MRIRLTAKQVQELRSYLDRVKASAVMGSPGMLVAQIGYDSDWNYWLTPAFLDHDLAKVITERGREEIPGLVRLEKHKAEGYADSIDGRTP